MMPQLASESISKHSGYSPGGRVNKNLYTRMLIRAFSDVEKPFFLFPDLAALTAKSGNKNRAFQRQRRL